MAGLASLLRRIGSTSLIRLTGAALLAALALLTWVGAPWAERQQAAWFDWHQTVRPRDVVASPVLVVEIDQASLRELGQWPWPRTHLAKMVDIVGGAGAAVIGIDILMPEADGLSPEQLAAQGQITDPEVLAMLRRLPTHDAQLAKAVAAAPVVLAMAHSAEATRATLHVSPVLVQATGLVAPAEDMALPHHAGALTNIPGLDAAAHGWGLLSVATSRGIIRRSRLPPTRLSSNWAWTSVAEMRSPIGVSWYSCRPMPVVPISTNLPSKRRRSTRSFSRFTAEMNRVGSWGEK